MALITECYYVSTAKPYRFWGHFFLLSDNSCLKHIPVISATIRNLDITHNPLLCPYLFMFDCPSNVFLVYLHAVYISVYMFCLGSLVGVFFFFCVYYLVSF